MGHKGIKHPFQIYRSNVYLLKVNSRNVLAICHGLNISNNNLQIYGHMARNDSKCQEA